MSKDKPKTRLERSATKEPKQGQVEKSLSDIFRPDEGEASDLKTIERVHRPWVTYVLIGLASFVACLLIAAWVGFSVFKPFHGFAGKGLEIAVDGPERVLLGNEMTYFINWQNASNEPLATAEMRVSFPSDFMPTNIEPKPNEDGMVWRLGSIPYAGRGTVTVRGVFTGALGTKTAIQVVGSYRPASFSSDFEALATRALDYAESVLAGKLDVPPKGLPGDKIRLAYQVENHGVTQMKGLEADITLPQGFVPDASSTSGQLEGHLYRVKLPDLDSGASSTVVVIGSFASGSSGDVPVHAETGRVGADGVFLPIQKADATIAVLTGDLSLKLVANGSDTDRSVHPSDMLHFALGYENTSPEELHKVGLRVVFEPIMASGSAMAAPTVVDLSNLDLLASATVKGGALSWDAKAIPDLDKLAPQQDGSIEFSVPVPAALATSTNGFLATAEATMTLGNTNVVRTIRTKPMVFTYRSDIDVTVEPRYYSEEGAPIGTGPLPPVAGQATTYQITWNVHKTVHEVKTIKVTSVLPKNVTALNMTTSTAGEWSYDSASRTVAWTLNRMPDAVDEEEMSFLIQLTPSLADAGRFAQLTGETRLEATDAQINEPIAIVKPTVTTDLQNDENAKSKGVVRKP